MAPMYVQLHPDRECDQDVGSSLDVATKKLGSDLEIQGQHKMSVRPA